MLSKIFEKHEMNVDAISKLDVDTYVKNRLLVHYCSDACAEIQEFIKQKYLDLDSFQFYEWLSHNFYNRVKNNIVQVDKAIIKPPVNIGIKGQGKAYRAKIEEYLLNNNCYMSDGKIMGYMKLELIGNQFNLDYQQTYCQLRTMKKEKRVDSHPSLGYYLI